MREQEMRDRLNQFLMARMRGMLVPALGVSLLAVGCKKEGVTAVYSAPVPDASQDSVVQGVLDAGGAKDLGTTGTDTTTATGTGTATGTKTATTTATVTNTTTATSVDAGALPIDAGALPIDAAPVDAAQSDAAQRDATPVDAARVDASPDVVRVEARPRDGGTVETGNSDAGSRDLGLVVKYAVPFFDGGIIGTLYMAQVPEES